MRSVEREKGNVKMLHKKVSAKSGDDQPKKHFYRPILLRNIAPMTEKTPKTTSQRIAGGTNHGSEGKNAIRIPVTIPTTINPTGFPNNKNDVIPTIAAPIAVVAKFILILGIM